MNGQSGKSLEIREVVGKKALKAFIRVPWSIYKDDPNWIPPLLQERKDALSSKNPFFRHAEWQAWIAFRDGEPVGRISAQIDQLHQQRYGNKTGFFGLIEAPDDGQIFPALFATAENWLREKGMQQVIGPFNLGINQEVGILVEGFDTPPRVMTTHSPRYYGAAIQNCGYQPAQDMLAYELDIHTYTRPASMSEVVSRNPAPGESQAAEPQKQGSRSRHRCGISSMTRGKTTGILFRLPGKNSGLLARNC